MFTNRRHLLNACVKGRRSPVELGQRVNNITWLFWSGDATGTQTATSLSTRVNLFVHQTFASATYVGKPEERPMGYEAGIDNLPKPLISKQLAQRQPVSVFQLCTTWYAMVHMFFKKCGTQSATFLRNTPLRDVSLRSCWMGCR